MHFLAAALFASALSGPRIVSLIALVGTALIIGSACVVNCISDRHLDALMERTKNRPLPSGEVTVHGAVIYAIILLALGAGVIVWLSNLTVLASRCSAGLPIRSSMATLSAIAGWAQW